MMRRPPIVGVPALAKWRLRPVRADRLALALLACAASRSAAGPNRKPKISAVKNAPPGPERDVAEEVEDVAAVGQGRQPVEHQGQLPFCRPRAACPIRRIASTTRQTRLPLEPLTSTTSPASSSRVEPGAPAPRALSAQRPRRSSGSASCSARIRGPTQWTTGDPPPSPGARPAPRAARPRRPRAPACRPGSRSAAPGECGRRRPRARAAASAASAGRHRGRVGVEGVVEQLDGRALAPVERQRLAPAPPAGRRPAARARRAPAPGRRPAPAAAASAPSAFSAKCRPAVPTLR